MKPDRTKFGVPAVAGPNVSMAQDFTNLYHHVKTTLRHMADHPYRIEEMNTLLAP